MKRHISRGLVLFLFICKWGAAQPAKGQQTTNPPGSANTQQQIPAQIYPLEQLARTRMQAEANLALNAFWDHSSPRYVWYVVTESRSVAIPLVLEPMTCGQMPAAWFPVAPAAPDPANLDAKFVGACAPTNPPACYPAAVGAVPPARCSATPSQPSQNRNPLNLGDGLILAIYDPKALLERFAVREVGLTIQTTNGTVLNTDPVRTSFSSSGGSPNASASSPSAALNALPAPPACPPAPGAPQAKFYYIAWAGNPLLGDTVLNVTVTTQGPAPIPLTIGADRDGATLRVNGLPPAFPTRTFPSGATVIATACLPDPVNYTFLRWSDGVTDRSDSIALGSNPVTVTAEYINPATFGVPVTVVTNPPGLTFAPGAAIAAAVPAGAAATCSPGPTVFSCPPSPGPINISAPPTGSLGGFQYNLQNFSAGAPCAGVPNCAAITLGKDPVTLIANYSKGGPIPPPLTLTTGGGVGLLARVSGNGYVMPQAVQANAGDIVSIDVPPTQQIGATQYTLPIFVPPAPANPYAVAAGPVTLTVNSTVTAVPPPAAGASQLTISTVPAGLFVAATVGLGGQVFVRDGAQLTGALGSAVTLDASLPQYLDNVLYKFQSWSDKVTGAIRSTSLAAVPATLTATFTATTGSQSTTVAPTPTVIPVSIATDPPGLRFSANGISQPSPAVMYFSPGSTVAVNTASTQTLAGVQYTFSAWSDAGSGGAAGGGSTSTAHNFTVPGGQQQQTPSGGGNQSSQSPPLAASLTGVFTQGAPGPTELSMTVLNAPYAQTHNISRFNVATGMIYSYLQHPSWSRVETAPAVTCPVGTPQPCIPSSALYQTVENPPSVHTVDPVLFFMIYLKRMDSERKWHPKDLVPAFNLGLSLSSPSTDYFVGGSTEIFVRGLQLVGGVHVGQVSKLAPSGVNDPTSSAAPTTIQRYEKKAFFGLTFNITFISNLFSPAKGGG